LYKNTYIYKILFNSVIEKKKFPGFFWLHTVNSVKVVEFRHTVVIVFLIYNLAKVITYTMGIDLDMYYIQIAVES